jgi:O-antigen/teichoic acid export membrane protein
MPRGHALLYMAPTVVQSLLPLVTLPIFTRVLSREEYGLWGIATAFGALVAGAAGLGLHAGFERSYFAAPDDAARGRLLYSVVLCAFAAQIIGLVVVVAAGPPLALRLMASAQRAHLFLLAFATAAFGSLKVYFLTTLRNEGLAREYVRYSIDELFLGMLLALAGVLWLDMGVEGLLVGPLLASGLVLLALAARFARRVQRQLDATQLRDTLRVSLPLAPRILIGAVGNQLDRLVLGAVGSLAGVGVYTIGQRMAQLVFAFMTALQNVYQPRVYKMLFAKVPPAAIGAFLLPFGYGSAAIALGTIVFSTEIVRLVAAPEYAAAAPILAVLSLHYGLMFFGKQPQLVFARRTALVSTLSLLTVGLNTVAVYVGAKSGGALGAATGMLVAGILTGAISLLAGQRFAPIGYPVRAFALVFGSLPLALALVASLHAMRVAAPMGIALKVLIFAGFVAVGWRAGLVRAIWRGGNDEPLST